LVSPAGFEPAASWFRTTRAGRLRYSEMKWSRQRESNSQHRRRHRRALPVELCLRKPSPRRAAAVQTADHGARRGCLLCHIQVVKEQAGKIPGNVRARRKNPRQLQRAAVNHHCEKIWYPTRDSNPESPVSETGAYADSASGALQKQKARGPCGSPGLGRDCRRFSDR
jgi:hypothetical protein